MSPKPTIAIIGAGPSGLMMADLLSAQGYRVTLFERMPTPGRKFLMAGRGGLNLTHSESLDQFLGRYGERSEVLTPAIRAFDAEALRSFMDALGAETFVGSSGRVFPAKLKASHLLRAWLNRLNSQGVRLFTRHRFQRFETSTSGIFLTNDHEVSHQSDIWVMALGGASWPELGATGDAETLLKPLGIETTPYTPSNMSLTLGADDDFFKRFAGKSLKNIALYFSDHSARGDLSFTQTGIEGTPVYALSALMRDRLLQGPQTLWLDLKPDHSEDQVAQRLKTPKAKMSEANYLRKILRLEPPALGLLATFGPPKEDREALRDAIKALPLRIIGHGDLKRAISSAGGVPFSALDEAYALRSRPNLLCVGEMLDWEAPTGGYLLQACFSTAFLAATALIKKYQT